MINKACSKALIICVSNFFAITGAQEAMALSGPTAEKMEVFSLDLSGDRRLKISLPVEGVSNDVPRSVVVSRIDLNGLEKPALFVDELWDWRGRFWQGVHGSLAIKIVIYPVPRGVLLKCEKDVRNMLKSQFEKDRRDFFASGGQERYLSKYTVAQDLLPVGDKNGVVYLEEGGYDGENVVVPITEEFYLAVQFAFLPGGGAGKSSSWRSEADKVKLGIINSMRFEGRWDFIPHCTKDGGGGS